MSRVGTKMGHGSSYFDNSIDHKDTLKVKAKNLHMKLKDARLDLLVWKDNTSIVVCLIMDMYFIGKTSLR